MKQTGRADIETKEVNSSDDAIKEIEEKVEGCKEIGEAFQLYMRQLQNDINASSEKFGFFNSISKFFLVFSLSLLF